VAFFGLSAAERPPVGSSELLWENPPDNQFVAVDVADLQGRYLPMSFVVRMPHRGPFLGEEFPQSAALWLETPLLRPIPTAGEAPGVYLWSMPTRAVPVSATAIRAQLVVGDGENPPPAAYALAEVVQPADGTTPEFRYFGMADDRGVLLLPFPYPPIPNPPGEEMTFPPLAQQTFNLNLNIYYDAAAQETLPGSSVPNLVTLLTQSPAQIGTHFDDSESPVLQTVSSLAIDLTFDQPRVLRTAIGSPDADTQESVLRILP
jgi:hypothetical protein